MGSLDLPTNGQVYMDANCFIYSVEGIEPYYTVLKTLWEAVSNKKLTIATSELTLLEVLVKPLKIGDLDVAKDFRTILRQSPEVQMMPIKQNVLEEAAKLRAATSLRTPDAIHVATALAHRCQLFLTNDKAFKQISTLPVMLLNDIVVQEDIDNSQ
jgi:predicted nucleic acid-binding protein